MCYNHDFTQLDYEYPGASENLNLIMDCIDEIDDNLEIIEELYKDKSEFRRLVFGIIEKGDFIKELGISLLNIVIDDEEYKGEL